MGIDDAVDGDCGAVSGKISSRESHTVLSPISIRFPVASSRYVFVSGIPDQ